MNRFEFIDHSWKVEVSGFVCVAAKWREETRESSERVFVDPGSYRSIICCSFTLI